MFNYLYKQIIKRLFFGLTFMLMSSLLFANSSTNESLEIGKDLDGLCTVTITAYNSDGEVTGVRFHTLPAESQEDCDNLGETILGLYRMGKLKM
jgi:hypothetical protein